MHYTTYVFTLAICGIIVYLYHRLNTKAIHRSIVERERCQPPTLLPNQWFPPFGLDKLAKVTDAERSRTYPLLMLQEHERYGDTYCQWGGHMYTVITRDPRNIREVLSKQFNSFDVGDARHGCIKPLLGDGIFTQDGPRWEASRRLLAPMINRPTLPDLKLIERHFQELHGKIISAQSLNDASTIRTVNLKPYLFDLSLRLTTEFLLGEVNTDLASGVRPQWNDAFAQSFERAFEWISKRERLKIFYWAADSWEFRRSCQTARNLVDELVCSTMDRRAQHTESAETYIALEPLLSEHRNAYQVRDQFMNLLLAGRDTSGALLSWTFYALAREPALAAQLRSEIEEILGVDHSRAPSKSELSRMIKLDQFVSETLRLFPPVPINGRFSVRATSLPHGGGPDGESPILVPSGTMICFSTFAVQRNQALYGKDANRFRIDRWDDARTKERRMVDWSYQPFIGGPRKCLGERFAITQAKYLICRMIQHYEYFIPTNGAGSAVKVHSDGSWVDETKYHVGLTMSPDEGVWTRLVPKSYQP